MSNGARDPSTVPQAQADDERGLLERTEARADEMAQHLDKSDWIELCAAVLLALATIAAAWAAYQSTRWGGEQADAYSRAGALRTQATQANDLYAAKAQIDVEVWLSWLQQVADDDQRGADFLRERMRDEFKPAFEAWLAQVPAGEVPPETPFVMEAYQPADRALAEDLNAQADAAVEEARDANQTGDNFVLAAVVMASVLFFAGVGTRFRGRRVRISMLALAVLLFLGGTVFIFSMPQDVGI